MRFLYHDPIENKVLTKEVSDGMTIGRKNADLVIRDGMISTKHARIEMEGSAWFLVDQASTNKIKVKDKKLERVELKDGVEFYLGNVLVKVLDKDMSLENTQLEVELEEEKQHHWSHDIEDMIKDLGQLSAQSDHRIYAFHFHVLLRVISGPEEGKSYSLLYGPRSFGNLDEDICIYDWAIDESSFQLVEHDGGIYLTTSFPDKITVNKKSLATVKLNSGDKIYLGQSCLEVEIEAYA